MKKILQTSLILLAIIFCSCVFAEQWTVTDSGDNTSQGQHTLRWAIQQANTNDGGAINFDFQGQNVITLTQGTLSINQPVTIEGSGQTIQFQGGPNNPHDWYSVFSISTTADTTTFNNLTIDGGNTAFNGAGISLKSGNLVLNNVMVQNGIAAYGGGIYIGGGANLTLQNGTDITLNTATTCGGGIYIDNGATVTIGNSGADPRVEDNDAKQSGGGVYVNNGGVLRVISSYVDDNTAICNGGGICVNTTGQATLSNAVISNNTAQNGGGIFTISTQGVTINQTTYVTTNRATNNGGGIDIAGGILTIDNSIVGQPNDSWFPNQALNGGGIAVDGGTVTIQNNSQICQNTATAIGGGLYMTGGTVNLNGNSAPPFNAPDIHDNQAAWGAGVYLENGATFNASYSYIRHNNCTTLYYGDQRGGGIYNLKGTVNLNQVEVDGNTCDNNVAYGAGIDNEGGTLTITRSTICWNDTLTNANCRGGGILNGNNYGTKATCTIVESTIYSNLSGQGGGICDYGTVTDKIFGCTIAENVGWISNEETGSGVYTNGAAITFIVCSLIKNVTDSNNYDIFASNDGTICIYYSRFGCYKTYQDDEPTQWGINSYVPIDDNDVINPNDLYANLENEPTLTLSLQQGAFTRTAVYNRPIADPHQSLATLVQDSDNNYYFGDSSHWYKITETPHNQNSGDDTVTCYVKKISLTNYKIVNDQNNIYSEAPRDGSSSIGWY